MVCLAAGFELTLGLRGTVVRGATKNTAKVIARSGPLSFCQELLFLNGLRIPQFRPVIAEVVSLSGRVDPVRIERALHSIIRRHEPLRSRYVMRKGVPRAEVMVTRDETDPALLLDASDVASSKESIKHAILAQIGSLDLGKGRVVSSMLAKSGDDAWLWMLAIHHLASDGWSQHIYGRSFSEGIRLKDVEADERSSGSSIDYAVEQTKWFESDAAEKQLEWWIDMLAPLAAQPVPLRAYKTEEGPPAFVRLEARIGSTAHAGLHDISRRKRVPLLAVVFAAFAGVIARRLQRPYVSALSLVGGRTLRGANRAVGAFYNSIVLSLDTGRVDEADLLRRAAACVFEAWRRQEVPLGLVSQACVNRGQPDVASKIPITFNLVRHPLADFRIPGCSMTEVDNSTLDPVIDVAGEIRVASQQATQFSSPLTVVVCDLAKELRVSMDIASHRYNPTEAADLLADYVERLIWFAKHLGNGPNSFDPAGSGLIYQAESG